MRIQQSEEDGLKVGMEGKLRILFCEAR